MPVYVDNMRMQARVGRLDARWSHLTADTDDELHALAARIGLRRAWHQKSPPHSRSHYDVTESKRAAAIAAGAIPVRWGCEPWRDKKRRAAGEFEVPPPAGPSGGLFDGAE